MGVSRFGTGLQRRLNGQAFPEVFHRVWAFRGLPQDCGARLQAGRSCGEVVAITLPIEGRAGIRLAARRDVTVPGNPLHIQRREIREQSLGDISQRMVLRIGVGQRVCTLELDAYRKVVAAFSTVQAGYARVPCARFR